MAARCSLLEKKALISSNICSRRCGAVCVYVYAGYAILYQTKRNSSFEFMAGRYWFGRNAHVLKQILREFLGHMQSRTCYIYTSRGNQGL